MKAIILAGGLGTRLQSVIMDDQITLRLGFQALSGIFMT